MHLSSLLPNKLANSSSTLGDRTVRTYITSIILCRVFSMTEVQTFELSAGMGYRVSKDSTLQLSGAE